MVLERPVSFPSARLRLFRFVFDTRCRYGLSKREADAYVLCDTIGSIHSRQWRTEAFRVVGDHEKPLVLQSLWKPREGLARRFEIQKRSLVEEQTSREKDTVTAGTVLWEGVGVGGGSQTAVFVSH